MRLIARLRLEQITKRFSAITALDDVSLSVSAGEIHAVLGENGAGKSTLVSIAYGLLRPHSGRMVLEFGDGRMSTRAGFRSPADARRAGIGMVHQHFTSIPAFTVSENIALTAGWMETGGAAERRAAGVIAELGLPLPARALSSSLSVQLRQRLEIVKALASDARVLLLDEPTAVLAPRETAELMGFLRSFAARGGAVVLITHHLDEALDLADHITVLRRGQVTATGPAREHTTRSLARAMLGSDPPPAAVHARQVPGDELVRANELSVGSVPAASFAVRAGEIVGVAAIEGNGQRELLRAVAGLRDVVVRGGTLSVAGPVAFIPEDRTTEGLIPAMTLTENVLLGTLDQSGPWLDWRALRGRARDLIATQDVRARDENVPAESLSGGNQQKLVVGRALARKPRVIVAEDPTRGLDLLATAAIHAQLREAARLGAAVMVHSSDLDEVIAFADRIIVVSAGRVSELGVGATRDQVGDAMLGVVAA